MSRMTREVPSRHGKLGSIVLGRAPKRRAASVCESPTSLAPTGRSSKSAECCFMREVRPAASFSPVALLLPKGESQIRIGTESSIDRHQVMLQREYEGFEARVDLQLVQQVDHVRAHRFGADEELVGNLAIGQPSRQSLEHLPFPRRQTTNRRLHGSMLVALPSYEAEHFNGFAHGQEGLTRVQPVYGVHDLAHRA